MTPDRWIWALAALWAVCFAMSFLHSFLFPPGGDGFGRAMAALGTMVLWQVAAMAVAIAALVVRQVNKGAISAWPRRLAPLPAIVTALLWLVAGLWLAFDLYREFGGDS